MSLYEFLVLGDPISAFYLLRLSAKDRLHFKHLALAHERIVDRQEKLRKGENLFEEHFFESLDNDFIQIFEALNHDDTVAKMRVEMDTIKKETDEKIREIIKKMDNEAKLSS